MYVKGKSVYVSNEIVGTMENFLSNREFTQTAFIDVEGAFSNTNTTAQISFIASFDISQKLLAWLSHMLRSPDHLGHPARRYLIFLALGRSMITLINELIVLLYKEISKVASYVRGVFRK